MKSDALALEIVPGLVALCATAEVIDRRAPLLREQPLVGRICDAEAAVKVSRAEGLGRLSRSTIVLLGQKHGNEDHHRLHAETHATLTGYVPRLGYNPDPRADDAKPGDKRCVLPP